MLGGLFGLGGAEFRLPVLVGKFHLPILEAVILNKAMSLIVVASALIFRAAAVDYATLFVNIDIVHQTPRMEQFFFQSGTA